MSNTEFLTMEEFHKGRTEQVAEVPNTLGRGGNFAREWPEPMPLVRPLAKPEAYPVDALGVVLGNAAKGIADIVQCPLAIAGCSVLAVASLASQAHADVIHPATLRAVPISLYILTIAETGERKSAADSEALSPVKKREADLNQNYAFAHQQWSNSHEAWETARLIAKKKCKGDRQSIEVALRAVGDEPTAPLSPALTVPEPTYEGLVKLYAAGQPSLGLFSAEGGGFIGGHAMREDGRLRALTGLSELWDGSPIKRIRAGDGALHLPGRRLALHLMVQPNVASMLLSDDLANGQGFLSRLLVCAPASTQGQRFQRETKEWARPSIDEYASAISVLLEMPPRTIGNNELDPRRLSLRLDAVGAWRKFADEIEGGLGRDACPSGVRGLSNKIAEIALRIEGVLAIAENTSAKEIALAIFERAVTLARYHLGEATRLYDAALISPEIARADRLLMWLIAREQDRVSIREIQTYGPVALRERKSINEALDILSKHGWVKIVKEETGGRPSIICILSPFAKSED